MSKSFYFKVLVFSILFLCSYILYLTFISFRYQNKINIDIKNKKLSMSFDEVSNIPSIPNVGVTTLPINALKAPYIINQDPKVAYELLVKASNHNPYIYYSEYLLASYFLTIKNYDSAYFYSNKAFYNWPKNLDHYKLYNRVLEAEKDTSEILKAYSYINERFESKEKYYLSFIDSYSNAKLRYLIFEYKDSRSVKRNELLGDWQQMYEYEGGKISYLKNQISFTKTFFSNGNNKYLYDIKNDTLNLKFVSTSQIISRIPIYYSDSLKTLILKNIPRSVIDDAPKTQDQFFKKINN